MIQIETDRLRLFMPQASDAVACLAFEQENREHFAPWDPAPPSDYFTEEFWRRRLLSNIEDWRGGRALRLSLQAKDEGEILGYCALQRIERGARQSCGLSYGLARRVEGLGFMREALEALLSYSFGALALHRVEAVYLVENARSARLLERLGFSVEGRMRQYALVAGEWRDHVLAARIYQSWSK